MNKALMTAAAVFFMGVTSAFAQSTVSTEANSRTMSTEAKPTTMSTTAEPATVSTEASGGICGGVTSVFECAEAAKGKFEAFAATAKEAPASNYPELIKELYGLRAEYLVWFNKVKGEGQLKQGASLRILLEQAVQPVIIGATNLMDEKLREYNREVTYEF